MKLNIEKWAEQYDPFDTQSEDLFKESILCYKLGIYKSAFLLSYLAFKITLRNRIIECRYRPNTFKNDEKGWKEVIDNLEDDDNWEGYLNKIIINDCNKDATKEIIKFVKKEKVKNEYQYWKEVRNKCVHAKKGTIDSSTVECFWNYLKDNLSHFYVLGGHDYLLQTLIEVYKYREIDYNLKHISAVLKDIEIVFQDNTKDFFEEFIHKLSKMEPEIINDDNISFWSDVFNSDLLKIQNGFIEVISKNMFYFERFYKYFPNSFYLAQSLNNRFVIDYLSKWLESWAEMGRRDTYWDLLIRFLDNCPKGIKINNILSGDLRLIVDRSFSESDLAILKKYNVFNEYITNQGDFFFDSTFDSIRTNHGYKEELIVKWFEYCDWSEELLRKVNNAYINLNNRIEKLKDSHYGGWEYHRLRMYKEVLNNGATQIRGILVSANLELDCEIMKEINGDLSLDQTVKEG